MSQEFRFKNIDETRNYLIEEIKQNELMICGYVSISAFASLVGFPIGIKNFQLD